MSLATPQARPQQARATPAPAADCGCAAPEAPVAGLPRFLQRFGGTGCADAGVQTKLVVGRSHDPFEQEADALAQRIVDGARAPGAAPAAALTPSAEPRLQRACASCEEAAASGADIRDRIDAGSESTSALAPSLRAPLEQAVQADLSGVRVHTGTAPAAMAQALHAKAFTHGPHIWLGAGQSATDLPLMAHEVAHVVQQGSGRARPEAVQRAPADYRVASDGGEVLERMSGRISEAMEGHEDEQPTGDAAARGHAARAAIGEVDRGELAQERGELEPEARPSVDRPAQEAPAIEQAAASAEQEADAPAEPLAEADAAPPAGAGKTGAGKGAAADGGAAQAQAAFSAAASVPAPPSTTPVQTPAPVSAPQDAGGAPLPADAGADAQVAALAQQAQSLRDESQRVRQFAGEERGNAQTLRGNLALVRGGITQAETGIATSREHAAFRQDLLGQAREGLAVSQQKTATVAAEAPNFSAKADEGKAESGPMASEASSLAAENAANTPDDPEAAANAQEQGGQMNQAGSEIATTDDAVTQTRAKAESLGADAAKAGQSNTATQARIDGMQETLASTGARLDEMHGQAAQARGEMQALAAAPEQHTQQARRIDERGQDLAEQSQGLEQRLHAVQADYSAALQAVPAAEPWTPEKVLEHYGPEALATEPEPEPAPSAPDAGGLVQRLPADSGEVETPPADGAEAPEAPAAAEPAAPDAAEPPDNPAAADAGGGAAGDGPPADAGADIGADALAEPIAEPAAPAAPERERVDAAGAVSGALPAWLTGVAPPNEGARLAAQDEAAQRRQQQIDEIESETEGGFAAMSATDRMGWAVRQTGRNLFGSVGNIQWPGWGHLALGLIDPRGPLMGVVSGLGTMLSGGANLLSAEQWRRDPLGNLLKSAADIATGLTVVLGSITALAGVIIAIMTAITILSFGTAAPVTGPVIAFCTTVLTTVGGWTIAVGKVALVLQALVFIKNLIDAACAETAAELQAEADQMTENVGDAGNVLMQMGMAKAGQLGGRAAASEIRAAGGGVRSAARMGARGVVGRAVRGVRRAGVGGYARIVGRSAARGVRGLVRRGAAGVRRATRVVNRVGAGRALAMAGNRGVGAARSTWRGLRRALSESGEGGDLSREFLVGKRPAAAEFGTGTRGMVREELSAAGVARRPAGTRAAAPAEPLLPEGPQARSMVADTPAAGAAEREASVARSSMREGPPTPREAANELAYVDDHPALIEGRAPNRRAAIGEHEIVEVPGGGCVRHSGPGVPIPCPVSFTRTERRLIEEFADDLAREGRTADEVLDQFGFRTEAQRRELFEGAAHRRDLEMRLREGPPERPVGMGSAADDIADVHRSSTGMPNPREEMAASRLAPDDPTWRARAESVTGNSSYGAVAERMSDDFLAHHFDGVESQVRIRPLLDNGQPADFYFIADNLGRSRHGGVVRAFDSKLSSGAPFTSPQLAGYPLLARNGGVVESVGRAGFAYGTRLGPTSTFRVQPRFNVRPRPGVPDVDFASVSPTREFFRLQQAF